MRALELYIEKLVADGNRKIAADPYAQPYIPRLGPEGARKLVQRAVKDAVLDAEGSAGWVDLILEEREAMRREITANGPALAIKILRKRAAVAEGEARRHAERASKSLTNLAGLHAREARKLQERRASLSPGRRIDNALASLSSVSMVPASALGGDQVRGGEPNRAPKWGGDQFGSSRARAVRLAVELEKLVDECKTRDLGAAA